MSRAGSADRAVGDDRRCPAIAKIYPAFGNSRDHGHSFAWRGSAVWADDVFHVLNANCR